MKTNFETQDYILPTNISSSVDTLENPIAQLTEKNPTLTAHGAVAVDSDILKWTIEAPTEENLGYNGLVVFLPGFLGIKRSSRLPRNELAQAGLTAITIEPVRKGDENFRESLADPQGLHVRSMIAVSQNLRDNRASLVQQIPSLAKVDFDRKLLVPHSMSGLSAPRFANLQSGSIEAIYGLATVGLGGPSLMDIATDFPRGIAGSMKHELLPLLKSGGIDINIKNIKAFGRYVLRLRTVFEALSCLSHSSVDEVDKLESKGIPYIYEAYQRDILVRPQEKVSDYVAKLVLVDSYGHLAPQIKARSMANRVADFAKNLN